MAKFISPKAGSLGTGLGKYAAAEELVRSSEDESLSWFHDPSQGPLAYEQQIEMGVGNSPYSPPE